MEKVYLVVNLKTNEIGINSCEIDVFDSIKSARKYFIDIVANIEKALQDDNNEFDGYYRDVDSFQVSLKSSAESYEIYIAEKIIKE